jgi:hypothetical protein
MSWGEWGKYRMHTPFLGGMETKKAFTGPGEEQGIYSSEAQ